MDGFKTTLCNYFTLTRFKNILSYSVLVSATPLSHRLFLGYVTSDLKCLNINGSILDTAPAMSDFSWLDQILWGKRPLVDLSQLSVVFGEFGESSL